MSTKKASGAASSAAERTLPHLHVTGIGRPELSEDTDERHQTRAQDARSTSNPVALGNGRSETYVADRTGRRSSIMINRCRRAARTFAELPLGDLASLDEAIPELGGQDKGRATGGGRR